MRPPAVYFERPSIGSTGVRYIPTLQTLSVLPHGGEELLGYGASDARHPAFMECDALVDMSSIRIPWWTRCPIRPHGGIRIYQL